MTRWWRAPHRVLGTPAGDGALAIGYALIAIEIAPSRCTGTAPSWPCRRSSCRSCGVLLLLGVVAFAGDFDAGTRSGDYILGGFWATWVLAAPSPPPARCPTRRASGTTRAASPARYGDRKVLAAAGRRRVRWPARHHAVRRLHRGGRRLDSATPTSADLVAAAPGWYVLPILVMGLAGGVGQGVLNLYATGLDLEALVPRLAPRPHDADRRVRRDRARVPRHVRARRGRLDHRDDAGAQRRRRAVGGRSTCSASWSRAAARTTRTTCRRSTRAAAAGATGSPAAGTCAHRRAWAAGSAFGLLRRQHDALHRPAGRTSPAASTSASSARRSSPPPSTCSPCRLARRTS